MESNIEELKSTGLKATAPRLKILEIFQTSVQRHMTAEDVYRVLLAENSDIGLATVYRVLTQFEQAGILNRNHFEVGRAVYELRDDQHHDHLVCLDCGHTAGTGSRSLTPSCPDRSAAHRAPRHGRQSVSAPFSIALRWRSTNSW